MPFSINEEKLRARRELHFIKSEKADYTPPGSQVSSRVHVRVFREGYYLGEDSEVPQIGIASRETQILFWLPELQDLSLGVPVRGGVIYLKDSEETFSLDHVAPKDGPTMTAVVTKA